MFASTRHAEKATILVSGLDMASVLLARLKTGLSDLFRVRILASVQQSIA